MQPPAIAQPDSFFAPSKANSIHIDLGLVSIAEPTSETCSPPKVTANSNLFMAPINHHQLNQRMQLPSLSDGFLLTRPGSFDEAISPVGLDARGASPFLFKPPSPFCTGPLPMISRPHGGFAPMDADALRSRSFSPFYPVTSTESEFGSSEILPSAKDFLQTNSFSLKRKRGEMDALLNEYVKRTNCSPGKRFNIAGLKSMSPEECVGKILRTTSDEDVKSHGESVSERAVVEAHASDGLAYRVGPSDDGSVSPARSVDDTMTDMCSSDEDELVVAAAARKDKNDTEVDDWGLIVPKSSLSPFLEAVTTQLLKTVSDDLLPSEYSLTNTLEERYEKLKLKHDKLNYMYMKELKRSQSLGL